MITIINQHDVVTMLAEHLHFTPKLKTGRFYRHQNPERLTITWSQNPLFLYFDVKKIEETISIGLPIFTIRKKDLSLYPQFINCLADGYENYALETNILIEVSFGKAIQINHPDGVCILSNELGHKVAFGEIKDQVFRPLIDLGWYLRSGS